MQNQIPNTQLEWVNQLINNNKQWDEHTITANFDPDIATRILQTEIEEGEDRLTWAREASGTYSVATSYKIAYHFFHPPMEQLPEVCRDKKMWKALWSLRCAPKIKVFIWKACHDGIAVRVRLNQRFHSIPNVCPRCEEEGESVNHCLIQCHLANQTWQLSPVSHLGQALGTQPF
ncbi:hypothetical protein AHAS_Ahas19G0040800 [Arachis hypogaea]